ncbi:caspase family protein [Oscillatoria sp. CS-180]|uniref:caspase family protein n=1 Tax=Oscillatoria sp. CS-180 TaxID=3021720 RepID=UPI00232EF03D|nr:caspase family protein [Oscillatoria sp. CS-180]MDB9525467.1 caspase family protein [Oscillatoria sp. CS-180]
MTLGRREFLQRLSAALAALGMTETTLIGSSNAYQQAFAASARCLALLVGINNYSPETWQEVPTSKGTFLQGAVTDVELQRELLVNRFGVPSRNIVTLVNAEATVNTILETIQGHLIAQAEPGDTVIFHFSGLGSRVHLRGHPDGEYLPTLVAADSALPANEVPVIQDLFEESIVQLLKGLKGVKILTVIDASAATQAEGFKGNFRVRSRPTSPSGIWQTPFDPQLQEPRKSLKQLSKNWPGFLLRANAVDFPALEGNWDSFSAGLFTYALTQQIWTTLPAQRQQWFIYRIDRKMSAWTGTDKAPQLLGQRSSQQTGLPLLTGRLPKPAADGVVKTIDTVNKTATLWLGGLSSELLPYCELGLRLQPLPTLPGLAAIPKGTLTVKTMNGLRAKAEVVQEDPLAVGTPLVEIERRFPKEITLTVALDPDLERIERVDATSALSSMSYISTTAPGERQADCLFGKGMLSSRSLQGAGGQTEGTGTQPDVNSDPPAVQLGYGLFTPDRSPITGTAAEDEEAVRTAISRLTAPLRSLLAVKMLRLTTNSISSQLPVRLSLETLKPSRKMILVEETLRSRQIASTSSGSPGQVAFDNLTNFSGDKCQVRLLNSGQVPLYYLLVSIVEKNRLSIYCPLVNLPEGVEQTSSEIAEASLLYPGKSRRFPQTEETTFSLQPLQSTEIFAIACTQPLSETWKAIRTPEFRQLSDRWSTISEPLAMTKALFRDLNSASTQSGNRDSSIPETITALKSAAWSTLSL